MRKPTNANPVAAIGVHAHGLITRFEKAVDAYSWIGSQPPDEDQAITEELFEARTKLENYIAGLQARARA